MLASFSNREIRNRVARTIILTVAFSVAGCTQPDIDRPGTWKPTGANEQNLRAMLVDQSDIERGQSVITSRGDSGARAVTRLLVDKRRPLLNVAVSRIGPSNETPADSSVSSGSGGGASGGTQ